MPPRVKIHRSEALAGPSPLVLSPSFLWAPGGHRLSEGLRGCAQVASFLAQNVSLGRYASHSFPAVLRALADEVS